MWKTVVPAVILLLLFIVLMTLWRESENDVKNLRAIVDEKNDSLRYERNDKGHIISQKRAAEATAKQLAEAYPEVVRELSEEFDVKMKDMKAYVQNQFKAQGQGRASITNNYYTDSTGAKVEYKDFAFDDGYLKFESVMFEGLDFGESKYTYTDTISTVIHRKKNWLFGKEYLYSSSSLKNANARVTGTTNLLTGVRDKRIVIYAGVGYDFLNNRPSLNVGVGYALIKF